MIVIEESKVNIMQPNSHYICQVINSICSNAFLVGFSFRQPSNLENLYLVQVTIGNELQLVSKIIPIEIAQELLVRGFETIVPVGSAVKFELYNNSDNEIPIIIMCAFKDIIPKQKKPNRISRSRLIIDDDFDNFDELEDFIDKHRNR